MKFKGHSFSTSVLGALLMCIGLAWGIPATAEDSKAAASIELGGTFLVVVPRVTYDSALLRVSGPGNYLLIKEFEGKEQVTADLLFDAEGISTVVPRDKVKQTIQPSIPLTALPGGKYSFEIFFRGTSSKNNYHSGTFFVEDSTIRPEQTGIGRRSSQSDSDLRGDRRKTSLKGINHDDFITVDDAAADDNTTLTLLNNGFDQKDVRNIDGDLRIQESANASAIPLLTVASDGDVGIGTASPTATLDIFGSEPFLVLDNSDANSGERWLMAPANTFFGGYGVYESGNLAPTLGLNASAPFHSIMVDGEGNIGFGTDTPQQDLHLAATSPSVLFEDTVSATDWRMDADQFGFRLTGSFTSFNMERDTGNLGLGALDPNAPLHVSRPDGSTRILVDERAGDIAARELFKLSNNGAPFFIFENRDLSESYSFAMGATGHFLISHQQTSGVQFRLHPNGDAEFQGDVTANGVVLDSSRTIKTDFSTVDEQTVLEKVAALNVSQWRYKQESGTERHIGPMAEDFQAMFGLGDGKHISVGDANGILFAATKALKAETSRLEAENEALKSKVAEINAVKARLNELESRISHLD